MIRNILVLLVFTSLAPTVSLKAEPTRESRAKRASHKSIKKNESEKQSSKTHSALKVLPAAPLAEGWNKVNGEWIHSDGYTYVNGKVIRTGSQTHGRPPKPPEKSLLDSVKKGPMSPADSAAAKAAEKERNLRPKPAPQTGTNL